MAVRMVPAAQVTVCDRCKVEHKAPATGLQPREWGKLKLSLDGTWKEADLCQICAKQAAETIDQFLVTESREAA
jgi:hypothetical protein